MKNVLAKRTIPNPPTYIITGKKKPVKRYTNYNFLYSGVHFSIRQFVIKECKNFIAPYIEDIPVITKPVILHIKYYAPNTGFDLDNKCMFWIKMFQDLMTQNGQLEDDQVKFVVGLRFDYERSDLRMDFIIEEA